MSTNPYERGLTRSEKCGSPTIVRGSQRLGILKWYRFARANGGPSSARSQAKAKSLLGVSWVQAHSWALRIRSKTRKVSFKKNGSVTLSCVKPLARTGVLSTVFGVVYFRQYPQSDQEELDSEVCPSCLVPKTVFVHKGVTNYRYLITDYLSDLSKRIFRKAFPKSTYDQTIADINYAKGCLRALATLKRFNYTAIEINPDMRSFLVRVLGEEDINGHVCEVKATSAKPRETRVSTVKSPHCVSFTAVNRHTPRSLVALLTLACMRLAEKLIAETDLGHFFPYMKEGQMLLVNVPEIKAVAWALPSQSIAVPANALFASRANTPGFNQYGERIRQEQQSGLILPSDQILNRPVDAATAWTVAILTFGAVHLDW